VREDNQAFPRSLGRRFDREEFPAMSDENGKSGAGKRVTRSDDEWREMLTPEQFAVCRQRGTERPFSGEYYDCKREGVYRCTCCGNALFDSEAKYDSGTGWPSFTQPIADASVSTREDRSAGMVRTEVLCAACDAHLGHVFPDGPPTTGKRYCMNSVALELEEVDET
jgi:peptide-methionine (R)-S-oxide reductase